MENTKIILENGLESNVNGIFYVFNSKYYFLYTLGEQVDNDYIQLYVVQVCKEVKSTPTGPVETGYMIGMETANKDEWATVQTSITKIVDDRKNGTNSGEIQYLPISMLTNLKIVSKNKLKLMQHLLRDAFNFNLPSTTHTNIENLIPNQNNNSTVPVEPLPISNPVDPVNQVENDVIIDYRTKFFEEQDKNKELEEQIKNLQDKLNSVKSILE